MKEVQSLCPYNNVLRTKMNYVKKKRNTFRLFLRVGVVSFMFAIGELGSHVEGFILSSRWKLHSLSKSRTNRNNKVENLSNVLSSSIISSEDENFYVHGISPKTQSLTNSFKVYTQFVIRRRKERRKKKKLQKETRAELRKSRPLGKEVKQQENQSIRETFKLLNQQRKNVVKLAGYNSQIVIPSFTNLLLGSFMTSVIPKYYSECLQSVVTLETSRSKLLRALVGLVVSSMLAAIFTGMRGCLFWIAGSRANYNVRVKLHRSLLLQEAAFFDSNEVGYLLSRLNNDVNKIGMVISFHVNVVLRQFAQCIFGSFFLLKISLKMSLWTFAGISIVAWVSAIYGDFTRNLSEKVQSMFANATAVAETSFTMSETIRSFNGVEDESGKYEIAQNRALELEEVQAWAYGTHKFVSDTLQNVMLAALLYTCWTMGLTGNLTASQLTTFIFYTNYVLESSNEVGDQWAKIQGAIGASTSVFDLIRRIPIVRDPPIHQRQKAPDNKIIDQTKHEGGLNGCNSNDDESSIIKMENMTVTYGAMEIPALKGIDLDIHPGDRVAIVGRSGSGKSSMLRTILRFYDPSSGRLSLMGKDLRETTREEIAQKVSVVSQEPCLFPMSLLENVLYGIEKDILDPENGEKVSYSEKYRTAAKSSLLKAGLPIEENNDLNLDLDTRVGEGGRALSGGQRQRVAIARALIRDPELLLLDEPTAALDSESEKKVVQAIKAAMEHTKSMVMVTHRLGVIRSTGVNQVLVMKKGKIVESGHPEELLRNPNSSYSKIALEQGITSLPDDNNDLNTIVSTSHNTISMS